MSTTLDLVCPSCGRTLRIAAEHAGKQVRCPACQQISAAPGAVTEQAPAEATAASLDQDQPAWQVRTPEGTVYGPIPWSELLIWVAEGRVAADCELGVSPDGPWRPAADVLPVLRTPATAPRPTVQPGPFAPFTPPTAPTFATTAYSQPQLPLGVAPHRGALVLVFGVLGIVVGCPVFSILAWIFGSRDLREMRAGRMDRQGEAITLVGMILGMIISLLWLLSAFILLSIALIAIAAQF